jgi:hypothetical protein
VLAAEARLGGQEVHEQIASRLGVRSRRAGSAEMGDAAQTESFNEFSVCFPHSIATSEGVAV